MGLEQREGSVPVGVLSSTPPSTPGLFALLASRQGFPKLSQRAGLSSPAPGNPWSLQAGVKSGRGRGTEARGGSSGGSRALAPSSGLPLSRDRVPGLPSVGLARSRLSSRPYRALVGLGLLFPRGAPSTCLPPQLCYLGPAHACADTLGCRWGMKRSECCKAGGLSLPPLPAGRASPGLRTGPRPPPAGPQRALAGLRRRRRGHRGGGEAARRAQAASTNRARRLV